MPQCMEKYKNDFAIRFATVMQKRLPFWKSAQNQERWELVSLSSLGIYLVSFLLGFVPGRSEHEYNLNFHIFCSICTLIIGIISVIHSTNKNYQDKIKQTLFPDLLKVFGDEIYYGKYSILGISEMIKHGKECKPSDLRILNGDFLSSDLFKSKKITQREDDDCFWGRYNDIDFAINETDFGYTTGNNKYARMFKGVAMHFKMNKKIKSRVLILSKKIGQYVPPNYEKVNVEYNKFNKKYNVWVEKTQMEAGGQIEARYLLTTVFLDRFMQISTSFDIDEVQCSIFDDSMLILLSTNKDLFEMNHLFGKIDDVHQYDHLFDEFASVLSFIDVLNLASKTGL